jgi:hypothetical protein
MKKILLVISFVLLSLYNFAQISVHGITPQSVAHSYIFSSASPLNGWGTPDFNLVGNFVQDTLVLAEDGALGTNAQGHPISQEGCGTFINNVHGKIAVVYRNTCEFSLKALNAQNAGAVGVIIINRDPVTIDMSAGTYGYEITIPVVMLSNVDGSELVNAMQNNDVELFIGNTIGSNPNVVGVKGTIINGNDEFSYSRIPFYQADSIWNLKSMVFNHGSNAQTNAVVRTHAGPYSFEDSLGTFQSLDTSYQTQQVNEYLQQGSYSVQFSFYSDNLPLDSSGAATIGVDRNFEITNNLYSVDAIGLNGTTTYTSVGSNSFGQPTTTYLATLYSLKNPTNNISGFEILLGSGTVSGSQIKISLADEYNWRSGILDAQLDLQNHVAESELYTVTESDVQQGKCTITFDQPIQLASARYYAVAQTYNGSNTPVDILDDHTLDQPWYTSTVTVLNQSGYPTTYSNGNAFAIRLLMSNQSCSNTFSEISITSNDSYQSPSGLTYTSSGIYIDTIPNAQGCDSIITINLTINTTNNNNCITHVAFQGVSPSFIANEYNFSWAKSDIGWGTPDFNQYGNYVLDTLVLAEDGTYGTNAQGHPTSQEGCNEIVNNVQGKIAVVYRNTCEFSLKALNAQNAGAVALIVINRDPEVFEMGVGSYGYGITIPVVMLSNSDGASLVDAMQNGSVVVRIGNNIGSCPNNIGITATIINGNDEFSYSRIPSYQADSVWNLKSMVLNHGSNAQTNAVVRTNAGPYVFYDSLGTFQSIDSSYQYQIVTEQLLEGDYTVDFSFFSDNLPLDSSGTATVSVDRKFKITNNLYSVDAIGLYPEDAINYSGIGSNSFSQPTSTYLATLYSLKKPSNKISGFEILLGQGTTVGSQIKISIAEEYNWRSGVLDAQIDLQNNIAEREFYTITESDVQQGKCTISFDQPIELASARYYAVAQTYNGSNTPVEILDDHTLEQPWYTSTVTVLNESGYPTAYSNGNAFAIRMITSNPQTELNATIQAVGNTIICQGDSVQLIAAIGDGYSYQWYRDDSIIMSENTSSLYATTSGNYYAIVSNQYAYSLISNSINVIVNTPEIPVLNAFG